MDRRTARRTGAFANEALPRAHVNHGHSKSRGGQYHNRHEVYP